MERAKVTAKRGPKLKALPPPGELIALGSKSTRPSPTEGVEPKLVIQNKSLPGPSTERKRESSSPLSSLASKKPKLTSTSSISRPTNRKEKETKKGDVWDVIAIECDSSSFLSQIQEAESNNNDDRMTALVCGSVKNLRANRTKPEAQLYLSLMFLAKTKPNLFCSDYVVEAFCTLLKRDTSLNFKTKGNSLVSVLAANILMAAFQDEKHWPDLFLTVYLEDALGERVWVDHEECKGFIENIQTAFNTKMPQKSMMQPEFGFKPDICPSPSPIQMDDDDTTESVTSTDSRDKLDVVVAPRYTHIQDQAENYILEIIKEQVNRRQPMDNISKNVLRLLTCATGFSEVRLIAAQRLESWLGNPKLMRPAQELLLSVCLNCNQHNQQDVEVIGHLIKIRLKTKPLINHYLVCIRELVNQNSENLGTLLKHTIYNELSNSRNPNNMTLLGVLFQCSPEQAAKLLAEVFQDLLSNREDYLRALRALFREIVRSLRHDVNFASFCLGLMQERKEAVFQDLEQPIKERMFHSVTDLITLSVFMAITPNVREAALRGDRKDLNNLRSYQQLVAMIQRDAVWWLQTIVPNMFKPPKIDFLHCLHKILFMEQLEHYYNKDNWPPENDRLMMFRLASEIPVLEDTLMRVMVMGLSKDHLINAPDAFEFVDHLIKRAAALFTEDFQVIQVDRINLIDVLFNICVYRYPENILLPSGYKPPSLAVSNLYWKAWILLLIITAHNPATFGFEAWEKYPTLNNFIEMCITNHFTFPPPTMAVGDEADEIKNRELQMAHLEKQQILEFETHLASATSKTTITESNSLLVAQLTTLDPSGVARKPPQQTLDQLKTLNETLKLGHLLCRSRNPDFLLEIIQRQGTSQSMPWLADLVESSEGAFSVLPVQCLCEFLLNESSENLMSSSSSSDKDDGKELIKDESKAEKAERAKKKEKQRKHKQLLRHLQGLLHESDDDPRPTLEVLDYFLRRLSSQQSSARLQAMRGLTMVVAPPKSDDEEELEPIDLKYSQQPNWLTKYLPLLRHFEVIRTPSSLALRQACQFETDPWVVGAYVQFLANYAPDDLLQDLADLALNMAKLIVERTTILNYILPCGNTMSEQKNSNLQSLMVIFLKYLRKAREQEKHAYSWSESQDQIIVQWATGEVATMHILVVHAMVILLTYDPPQDPTLFSELLEIWFPSNGEPLQAYLADTSEEALLLPDWLKLRMIRSNVEVLVDAALRDLDPSQLVLFIQSFGIPVANVSKLLQSLDAAVEYAISEFESVVADKTYMLQLVDVQRQRGAVGGLKFVEALGDDSDMSTESQLSINDSVDNSYVAESKDDEVLSSPMKLSLTSPVKTSKTIRLESLTAQLSDLFQNKDVKTGQEFFRLLHKTLLNEAVSNDIPIARKVITSLKELVLINAVVEGMYQKSSLSCPLFRVLELSAKKEVKLKEKLIAIAERVLEVNGDNKSCLIIVLKKISRKSSSSKDKKLPQQLNDFTEENIIKAIRQASKESPAELEKMLNKIFLNGMKNNSSTELISALTRILLNPEEDLKATTLFVGWLQLLEPEIVNRIPELQEQLLFSARQEFSFRSQLLAILTHQSKWTTLHECLARILKKDHVGSFDPTAVLDFVSACIYIPKLWQGRDKHVPKHYDEENLLNLSKEQVCCVVDYILEESLGVISKSETEGEDSEATTSSDTPVISKITKNVIALLEKRRQLVLHCCNDYSDILSAVVSHLLSLVNEEKSNIRRVAHCLLQQIYLQVPKIISQITNLNKFLADSDSTLNSSSKMDAFSQALITALASTEAGKDWNEKIPDIDLACRKMAACHPILMLRQLPMLAALLRGRTQLEFHVFKSRNHLLYFNCVLGVLELLQPYLFMKEYNTALLDTFESYFDLIKNHGLQNKDLCLMINRFLTLLHNFIASDSQRSIRYIQKHAAILHDLSTIHPDLQSLRLLLAGISLPPQNSDEAEEEFKPTMLSFTPTQSVPSRAQVQYAPLLNRLTKGANTEEVVSALQEIDSLTSRKPDVLEYFGDDLKKLLTDQSESCRNLAHNLIVRLMKQNPKSSGQFLNAFLSCLDSDQHEIITSALDRLAEFVLLSQENAAVLLEKAYVVGISGSVNTLPHITETMMLLNMQSGS